MGESLGNLGARAGALMSENVRGRINNFQNVRDNMRIHQAQPNQNQFQGQLNQLQLQRPCEQLPQRNIRGDIQSHIDAEEFNQNVEGVCNGLVPQQRIPLPNQQHQPLPRNPSQDSFVDDPCEHEIQQELDMEIALAIEGSGQSMRNNIFGYQGGGQSMDDVGMDEFDVADERAHLFGEQVNPDIMTYEQLIALQERIGYVNKGMTVQEMDKFPRMKFCEIKKFLKSLNQIQVFNTPKAKSNASIKNQSENLVEIEEVKFGRIDLQEGVWVEQQNRQMRGQQVCTDLKSPRSQKFFEFNNKPNRQNVDFQERVYIFEGEERKSLQDDESLMDKSGSSVLSLPNEIHLVYPNNLEIPSHRLSSQHNQEQSAMNQMQQRKYIFQSQPKIEYQQIHSQHSQRRQKQFYQSLGLSNDFEEGKEDLEDAAPEKHHPKEEYNLNMSGHFIQPFVSQSQHLVANEDTISNCQQNLSQYFQEVRKMREKHPFLQNKKKPNQLQLSNANIQNNIQPMQQIRVNPPVRNMINQSNRSQEIIIQPRRNENGSRQLESLDEENEEGSQEDVFDEGEDICNRRLPHLANINGSIPNQQPCNIRFVGESSKAENSFSEKADSKLPTKKKQTEPQIILSYQHNNSPMSGIINLGQEKNVGQRQQKLSLSQAQAQLLLEESQLQHQNQEFLQFNFSRNQHKGLKDEVQLQLMQIQQEEQNRKSAQRCLIQSFPLKLNYQRSNKLIQGPDDPILKDLQMNQSLARSISQLSLPYSNQTLMSAQEELKDQFQFDIKDDIQTQKMSKMSFRHVKDGSFCRFLSDHSISTPKKSVLSLSQAGDICIICQYLMKPDDTIKLITPCNHYFHVNCVNQWLLVEKKCPLCMHSLS